jgi:uncharacterized protein YaiE (UPF0345 family)
MSSTVPTEIANVTAVCKANVFFDGKVVSHTIRSSDGGKQSLGLIYPGEYHFGTAAPEKMEMVAGNCRVKLDGSDAWQDYPQGTFFRVPGNSGFTIAVEGGIVEYLCTFE